MHSIRTGEQHACTSGHGLYLRQRSVLQAAHHPLVPPPAAVQHTSSTGAYLSSSLATQLDHDVALVRLDWPIGYRTGWLGVTADCRDGETLTLHTAGYPGEYNDTSNICVQTQCPVTFLPAQAAQVRCAR